MQNFKLRKILRGYYDKGNWHVVDPKPAGSIEDVEFSLNAVAPNQIAENV